MSENKTKDKESFSVLWVDDDTMISENASDLVEVIGHKCDHVNSGHDALEYFNKNTYDIIFTDIGMPEMNGWELANAIRNKFGRKIKIVAVTGWDIEVKAKEEGSIDFVLQKPFTMEELRKIFLLV
ncbi:MAG: CheY-like chemotaxis protein [Parvicella sp.]|jgi:CheY-like chemotaxis protein